MFKDSKAFSGFSSNDIPRAKQFYGETLGLNVSEERAGSGCTSPAAERSSSIPRRTTTRDVHVLNFPVEDVDEAVDRLTEAGVPFERYEGFEQDEKGIARGGEGPTIAWFKDPAGNILSVLDQ